LQDIGALRAKLLLEAEQFKKGMNDAKEEMKKTGKAAKDTNKGFENLNKSLKDVGLSSSQIDKINEKIKKANPKLLEKDFNEVREELKKLGLDSKEIDKLAKEIEKASKTTHNLEEDLNKIRTASLAIGTAIVAGVGASVGVAANFEKAMSRVKAISGATEQEFEALKEKAKELGETTQFSASQAAEGMQFLSMAGFDVNEILSAMPSVLNLAAAAQIDLGRSADIVSNIMTGFGISAEDTSHAVDVLVKTMTSANTDLPQLGEAMKYVAPVAASLGLSIEETAAAVAKMSDAGIQGSMAGTALRASLLSLASPTGETEKAMDKLGIKVTDANGKMKPLPKLIGHIAEKLEGMTDAQKTSTIAQLVGTEAASGFIALIEQGEGALRDYTKELKDAGGTADRVAKTQMDNLLGSFEEFKSALQGTGIELGEEFLPIFTEVVRVGTDMVRTLGELNPATVSTGVKMAGTAAAIGLVGSSVIKLIGVLRTLSFSMGPAGWMITSLSIIGGLLVGISQNKKRLSEVSLETVESLSKEQDKLESIISEYEDLRNKASLTNDELARFVDINSKLQKTADPKIIENLRKEQEQLREKSGLSNDEMQRLIDLNNQILEVVPDSSTALTEQGNVLLENTDKAKAFNSEQVEMIRLELEAQKAKAEANMKQLLTDEKRLMNDIKSIKEEMNSLDKEEYSQREKIKKLEEQLAIAKKNNDESEANRLTFKLALEKKKLEELKKQRDESANLVVEKSKELDKIKQEIGKLDKIKQQMIELELRQAGINFKKGEGLMMLDREIARLQEEKESLELNTKAADKKTGAYREAVREIDKQLSNLQSVRRRISDIIGEASRMNSLLGKPIYKDITINERKYQIVKLQHSSGRNSEYHTGGIVGRGQMPQLHTGGLASWFANAPMHNEIDVRLLRNEMVLTEAQQANLMRMIDAGFSNRNSSPIVDERVIDLLRQIERGIARGFNATVVMNEREVGRMVEPYVTEQQQFNEDRTKTFRG